MAARQTKTQQNTEIRINGKSLTASSQHDLGMAKDLISPTGRRSKSNPTSPTEASAVDQVMDINRRLVAQIETLRLKVEVDARHQEQSKRNLLHNNDQMVQSKDSQIENLKKDLAKKEDAVKGFTQENERKAKEIKKLEEEINELKEDVRMSKVYAKQIQDNLDLLQSTKNSLENGHAYKEKDEEIYKLQSEVDLLKNNLVTLEKELAKAKDKIAQQGSRLRLSDNDRTSTQSKFKEELAKVTQTMRNDIERMREVMHIQWDEMRQLREQNENMRQDIKEIRELLSSEVPHNNQNQVYGHVQSPYDLQPLSPSLPSLQQTRRNFGQGRKKT